MRIMWSLTIWKHQLLRLMVCDESTHTHTHVSTVTHNHSSRFTLGLGLSLPPPPGCLADTSGSSCSFGPFDSSDNNTSSFTSSSSLNNTLICSLARWALVLFDLCFLIEASPPSGQGAFTTALLLLNSPTSSTAATSSPVSSSVTDQDGDGVGS